MRILVTTAVAFILAFAPSLAVAGVETSPTLEDASRVVDAFHKALKDKDGDAVQSLLDEKVQIYEQGWVERSKSEYASHHLGADMKFAAATDSSQTSRSGVVLDDLAYVSTEGRTTGTFEGKPVNSITLETMILRHTADGWRIVHIHWSSRKPK